MGTRMDPEIQLEELANSVSKLRQPERGDFPWLVPRQKSARRILER